MQIRKSTSAIAILVALAAPLCVRAAEDADQAFQQATKLIEPYLVLTDRSSADARTEQGRVELARAITMLTRITEANPGHWPSYWFIGKANQALRDHSEAFLAFKRSLNLAPSNPSVAKEFVIEAICTGATSEAVAAAGQVADSNPSNAGLLSNLGLALLADGKVPQAREVTERALAMAPSDRITRSLLEEIIQVQAGRTPSKYCPT